MAAEMERAEVTRLFQALPGLLDLPYQGKVRVTARFRNGLLRQPLQVAEFRIPADRLDQLPFDVWNLGPEVVECLEELAKMLRRDTGDIELVAEYKDGRLLYVDRIIDLTLGPIEPG